MKILQLIIQMLIVFPINAILLNKYMKAITIAIIIDRNLIKINPIINYYRNHCCLISNFLNFNQKNHFVPTPTPDLNNFNYFDFFSFNHFIIDLSSFLFTSY